MKSILKDENRQLYKCTRPWSSLPLEGTYLSNLNLRKSVEEKNSLLKLGSLQTEITAVNNSLFKPPTKNNLGTSKCKQPLLLANQVTSNTTMSPLRRHNEIRDENVLKTVWKAEKDSRKLIPIWAKTCRFSLWVTSILPPQILASPVQAFVIALTVTG